MKKVFFGGTANSFWLSEVFNWLVCEIDAFGPALGNWDEGQRERKNEANLYVYVITPKFQEFYSVAEAVDDSNKNPEKVVFGILSVDYMDDGSPLLKSLEFACDLVERNGGKAIRNNLLEVIHFVSNNDTL